VYKVSKRIDQDISSVCGAFNITTEENASGELIVKQARICFGGMAGTPLRALACEKLLTGRAWSEETIQEAMAQLKVTYEPLSDARASAEYRNRVAANLLYKFFVESQLAQPVGVHEIHA
jgi:xanthine dehydrogenase small subunit